MLFISIISNHIKSFGCKALPTTILVLKYKRFSYFLIKYENRLHFKTNIKIGDSIDTNDFIWFDLIDKNNANKTNRLRFQYIYSRVESILDGLNEYHKCAKFCTSEKPPKRQKRNDYESSNSRK